MNNVEFVEIEFPNHTEIFAIIDNGDGFTSMPKSVYDEQQANQAKGTIS